MLNKKLNLVVNLDNVTIHSTPISKDVFERYYKVIGRAFNEITANFGVISGPRLAYLSLKDASQQIGGREYWEDVQNGLINEIIRLSVAFVKTDAGWQQLPLVNANVDEDDYDYFINSVVFFICVSTMHTAEIAKKMLQIAQNLGWLEITSLACTEYKGSLPILTETNNLTVTPSLIPS